MHLNRWLLPLLGGVYGICFYYLAFNWPSDLGERLWLFLIMFLGVFGAAGLMFAVPLGFGRAALVSAALAGVNALLMLWTSFGFETISDSLFLSTGRVWIATVLVPMPFILAALQTPSRLWDYDYLYQTAWGLFARYVLAGLFSGIGIGILFGFGAALELVGISLLAQLMDQVSAMFFLWGALFGLGVAVLYEVEEIVASILRLVEFLLRALLPVIVIFSTIFLIALFTNLGEVDTPRRFFFGGSIASFYGAMLLAGVVFLTAACSVSGKETQSRIMIWMCRVMAVNSGILAALVLWAVLLRVGQYGWTPDRLLLLVLALLGLIYGLGYIAALFWGQDWWRKVRQVNIAAALFTVLAGVLWLTPVLDANRISANSQEARVLAQAEGAQNAVASLELWGRDGAASIERLRNNAEAVAFLETPEVQEEQEQVDALDLVIYLNGEDYVRSQANEPDSDLSGFLLRACRYTISPQYRCYVALADDASASGRREILVFGFANLDTPANNSVNIMTLFKHGSNWQSKNVLTLSGPGAAEDIADLLTQLQRGEIPLIEVSIPALRIGDRAYPVNSGPIAVE